MGTASFQIMGVLNVTPDSFSDGGSFLDPKKAVEKFQQLIEEGADWIDIGGESTKPGAVPVSSNEQWSRIEPVLKTIRDQSMLRRVSIDTRSVEVMQKAIDCGVGWINCVGNVPGEGMTVLENAAKQGIKYCAAHMHGEPRTMQHAPLDPNAAVDTVRNFFSTTYSQLKDLGFAHEQIYLDPGIGFGKSEAANWTLLGETRHFAQSFQILIGVSRKSFLGKFFQIEDPLKRDDVSHAVEFGTISAGAKVIRTHDVKNLNKLRRLLEN